MAESALLASKAKAVTPLTCPSTHDRRVTSGVASTTSPGQTALRSSAFRADMTASESIQSRSYWLSAHRETITTDGPNSICRRHYHLQPQGMKHPDFWR